MCLCKKVQNVLLKPPSCSWCYFRFSHCFPGILLCCFSVTKLSPTLCDPMSCSTSGSSVLHYVLEFAQIHIHWISNALWSSAALFSISLHSFRAWGTFAVSWLLTSGDQNIGVSASISILPMNIQSWFPLGTTTLISLQSEGFGRVFSSTTIWTG